MIDTVPLVLLSSSDKSCPLPIALFRSVLAASSRAVAMVFTLQPADGHATWTLN